MIKNILCIFSSIVISLVVVSFECQAQHSRTFVRKKVQPNYFIPEKEIKTKVEKLPQPKFTHGEDSSITNAKPIEQPRRVVKKAPETIQDTKSTETQDTEVSAQDVVDQSESTPEYQKKYQEYIADLDSISNDKEAKYESTVAKDLSSMNSNERIIVDKKFNQQRNVKGKFNNTLNNVLSK